MPLLRFIPEATKFDFVKWRFWAVGITVVLLLVASVSIGVRGFNLGIDFTGGVLMEVKSAKPIDIAQMREQVNSLNFPETGMQYFGGGVCDQPVNSCVMIRIQPHDNADQSGGAEAAVASVKAKLGTGYEYRRTEVVGPRVSGELFRDGVIATLLAVVMIGIYVAVRFEWQYGISALLSTFHDVFVTAGFFSLFQLDFNINTVAALLLLAGYSINDTVVVFDRIRENRRKYKRMPLKEMINLSTNQMLTRTILVSGSTALSVIPLLWGGHVLENFSIVILFGIVLGTFSSIYVAATLLLWMPEVGKGVVEQKPGTATA